MRLDLGNKKRRNLLLVCGVVLVLVVLVLIFIYFPKNCKSNEECFNFKASQCSRAKASLLKNDNVLEYKILGKRGDDCVVRVIMKKVSGRQSDAIKLALEGKSMNCAIPKTLLQDKGLNQINNVYDYCTGSLKETFLDITLQKMYDLVVRNIGTLTSGLQQVLNQSAAI